MTLLEVAKLLPNGFYSITIVGNSATFKKSWWDQRDGEGGTKYKEVGWWRIFENEKELLLEDQNTEMKKLVETFKEMQ